MDIDEKKKTDAKLLWRDTLADIMTQNLDSVYIILDKHNRESLYVSLSIEKIFGIRKDIPHPLLAVQELEQPESDDFSIEEVKQLPEGQSQIKDSWIIPVGETKAKMFQKTLYHVVCGREDLLIFEFADHTHEQEIRKNIEDALEIAKSANAAKSSFLSNMSHDIRTPMDLAVLKKTIKKFLGSNYEVDASGGHVRDLPKSQLGFDPEHDYEPKYITIRGKGDVLAKLRKEVKKADKIYLATDPDREGEAISWHLMKALKLDELKNKQVYRISFNEITKNAVKASLKSPRDLDINLVNAQQTRRMLDRMVGYRISPLLWSKVKRV